MLARALWVVAPSVSAVIPVGFSPVAHTLLNSWVKTLATSATRVHTNPSSPTLAVGVLLGSKSDIESMNYKMIQVLVICRMSGWQISICT